MGGLGAEHFAGAQRFELRRRLGAGAFGVVYEAFDRERRSRVALKTLRRAGEEARYRLKQEFRSLADLVHPNLVTLYELLSDGEQWFFTMELIDGMSFLEYVRRDGAGERTVRDAPVPSEEAGNSDQETESVAPVSPTLSEAEVERVRVSVRGSLNVELLRGALRQTAAGIRALHTSGKLHRDIKSSNVLVTRTGRVVLLDFGLVTELDLPRGDQSMAMAGTPAYMSPEQGAGLPVTEASDWYSLGVMLYEGLTGRSPFVGRPSEMMREKQRREPQPPHKIAAGIPEDLDRLCVGLLRRDPSRRPTGREILLQVGGDPAQPAGAKATVSESRGLPFVGRRRQLTLLEDALEVVAAEGRAVTLCVHGGSGMGKTALVRRFLDSLKARDEAVVLAGRCFERESVPYKALDSLMDSMSHYLKGLPSARAEALMPRDVLALTRLFPVLRRVEAVAGARRRVLEIRDAQELRRRAFAALRELMGRFAEETLLVLFIDDLHWGDADSAALLEELMRPPEAPAILLILAYRTEEALTSPLLSRLLPAIAGTTDSREVIVERLDPLETRDLAQVLLRAPVGSDPVVESIARESGGNPFFLSELARSVEVEAEGAPAGVSGAAPGPAPSLEQIIQLRVARLPEDARRLVEVLSVAGGPVEFAVAKEAADLETREGTLEILRVGHLVRTRETQMREEIEPYHDRIREAVAAGLDPETRKTHHRRLALALEASGHADAEALAEHLKEAGELDRAAEYAGAAADRASETLAFDRAARLFSMALELSTGGEAEARRLLQVKLGDALANAGRGADAASSYLSASRGARTAEALELQRRAAEQLLRSGHIDMGLPVLRDVLRKVGFRYPESSLGSLLSFVFHRLQIRLRGLSFRERDAAQIAPESLIRIDTCWSLSLGLSMIDTLRGKDFQARHLLLALKAGEPYRIARAISNEAGYSATGGPPNARRTAALVDMATSLAARVGHPQAIGIAQVAVGITAYAEGRWKASWDLAQTGESILREHCTGVAWELDTTHIYSLRALFYMGRIAELIARLPLLIRDARDRDDLFAETSLRARHSYAAWLAADKPERARSELRDAIARWSTRAFYMQHYYALVAEGDIALYMGDPASGSRILRERQPALERSRLLRVHHLRIEWLHLCARILIAQAAGTTGTESESRLREAEAIARRIERERVHWADALAALVRASIAFSRGNRGEAARRLGFAACIFAIADMGLYAAVTRRRLGAILGGERGRALVESADAWMRGEKIEKPSGFADMLAPGRWRSGGSGGSDA